MITRKEFREQKSRLKEEAKKHHPAHQPEGGPRRRKIVEPDEVKTPHIDAEEEKRREDKEAGRLMQEANLMQTGREIYGHTSEALALAMLATRFNMDLTPRRPVNG